MRIFNVGCNYKYTMKRLLFLALLLVLFTSCNGQSKTKTTSSKEQICRDLISHLSSNNYDKAVEMMDKIVLDQIHLDTLKNAMASLSKTLKSEFKGEINHVTFMTSEKTFLNDLPAVFMIFKLESNNSFGFYYFYLNEKTDKVMLISRFTKIEPKRS